MDKLTEIIQEARPLYKRRKKVRIMMTSLIILAFPAFFASGILSLYNSGNEVYLSLNNNQLQDELMLDNMKLLR